MFLSFTYLPAASFDSSFSDLSRRRASVASSTIGYQERIPQWASYCKRLMLPPGFLVELLMFDTALS